ncbi:hypothetical protein Ahy_A08g038114 [Arachis hypogaea]|uniref:Aminotransferase-like plant mobile domain-containing protein n=1 Tax=Arachis hypogaea TaxID=3818 RepID=A0A445BST3_ARAHY|nr:hypothetical protein Ahy_A08g038114 [Arachis hypogaea]
MTWRTSWDSRLMVIPSVAALVGGSSTMRDDPLRTSASGYWVLFWAHRINTVCRDLKEDTTEECLFHYTREYIMQVIGDILFSDASDSRVHIRWLPLLEDLDTCGRLSWGSVVLAWLYRQMCRVTEHSQHNLSGCAYHHIRLLRPNGFETRRFALVKRWVEYHPDNDRGKNMLRYYRRTLNGISILYDVVPPGIAL